MSSYLFATCRVGAEGPLKAEAARYGLRPAFMRPGFTSWKSDKELGPDFVLESVFAHSYCASYDRTSPDDLARVAPALAEKLGCKRVHVFSRAMSSDDEDEPDELSELAAMLETGVSLPRGPAQEGELVLDVLLVDPNVVMLGAHKHTPQRSPYAGGVPPLFLPPEAPSRAWLKVEEALTWHKDTPRAGEVAIEIGSAPGGTAYALLERGLRVFAIDPAEMDRRLIGRRMPAGELALVHVKKPAAHIAKSDIDPNAKWLLIDINEKPDLTLKMAEKTIGLLAQRPSLILTLKFSDWSLAKELDSYRARVASWGYRDILLRQLAHGRREVVLIAVR